MKAVKAKPIKQLAKSSHARPQPRPADKNHAKVAHPVKASPLKVVARPVTPAAAAVKSAKATPPAAKSALPAAAKSGRLPAAAKPADAGSAAPSADAQDRQGRRSSRRRETRGPAAADHARGPPVAAQAADRARQGTGLPDLRRSQRSPADDIVDPEQIEDIMQMINDMGIPVYEKAPDAEVAADARAGRGRRRSAPKKPRRRSRPPSTPKFGRTTDPVRMYMREMGTVELLTREGEIAIAKRIEEGLDSVRRRAVALSADASTCCSRTTSRIKDGQGRLVDIIVGFRRSRTRRTSSRSRSIRSSPRRKRRTTKPRTPKATNGEEEEAIETGPDPEEVARRFARR